jgi:DNA modification methylase
MIVQLNNCTEDEAWDLLTDLRVNKRKEVNTIYESVKATYNSIKNEQKALKEEVYKDDYFQIIHADSNDLREYLEDEMIDTIPTSPPYFNAIRTYQEDRNIALPNSLQLGHESTPEEYIENLMKTLRECIRVLKTTGSIFINVQDHTRDGVLMNIPFRVIQAMEKEGLFNVQNIIWYKINPIFQNRKTFIPSNEYILHFVKNVKTYKWRNDWFGKEDEFLGEITHGQPDGLVRQFRSVLIYPSNDIKDGIGVSQGLIQTRVLNNHYLVKILKEKGYELQHNALFPLEVPMICILSTTDRGDSVLDVFSGMATTGLIAYAHGCKYYGVDKSKVYSVKAGHRIQHFLDNHPHLVKRNFTKK